MHYLRPLTRDFLPGQVLDAGCGTISYTKLLSSWFPNARIRGIDILKTKEWDSVPRNVTLAVQDLRTFSDVETYDLAVSVDVLEHIPDNKSVILSLIRSLRPGGYLYIAVPSETEEQALFPRRWFGRFREWEADEHVGEQHTLEQLKSIVGSAGMNIKVARHTFTFFGNLAWEMEILLHWQAKWGQRLRIVLMPLFKLLGILDIYMPIGSGNNLIFARKSK